MKLSFPRALRVPLALTGTLVALHLSGGVNAQASCADLPAVLTHASTPDQIACALTTSRNASMARGIVLVETEEPDIAPVRFAITFEFGSAQLTPASEELLKTVAQVIANDEALSDSAYFIDGHTDAVGSAEANDRLGMARAQSAASFILSKAAQPLAVKVRSFGESRLLNASAPNDGINRRVEITPVRTE